MLLQTMIQNLLVNYKNNISLYIIKLINFYSSNAIGYLVW